MRYARLDERTMRARFRDGIPALASRLPTSNESLHVWAWDGTPKCMLADSNTRGTCAPSTGERNGQSSAAVRLRCMARSYHKLCTAGVVAPMAESAVHSRIIT